MYEDLLRAVTLNVLEDAALEFKGQRRADENAKDELGKDVAAMANSGGGIIAFGVGEHGAGPDKHLVTTPVELVGQAEQQIRAIVWARVRPIVAGIQVEQVPDPQNSRQGFLLVAVPASPEAPHFYEKAGQPPVAPWRNGPHTEIMREREIERAYRDRFARQDAAAEALAGHVDELAQGLDFAAPDRRHWLVIVSRANTSVPIGLLDPDQNTVRTTVTAAEAGEVSLLRNPEQQCPLLGQLDLNPRRGLRRWVLRAQSDTEQPTTSRPYAELHHSGATALAFPVTARRTSGDTDERPAIQAVKVEQVAAAAVAITTAWHTARALGGGAALRAGVVTDPADQQPLWVYGSERAGSFGYRCVPSWTRPLHRVAPVDVPLPTSDLPSQQDTTVELAEGILHQFGYGQIEHLLRAHNQP